MQVHAKTVMCSAKHTYDVGSDCDANKFERLEIFSHNPYGYEYQLPKYEST